MKSFRKVLTRTRYDLRSNTKANTSTRTSTPRVKVNNSVQVNLSEEEDNCTHSLFTELPRRTSPSADAAPGSGTFPSELNSQNRSKPRSSTAFSTLDHADVTTRDPLEISLDLGNEPESVSQSTPPNSPEFGPRDFQSFVYSTPQPTSSARIALQVEDISDSDDIEEPEVDERTQPNPTQSQPPDIHSPADLANLVPRTSIHTEPDASDGYKSSTSETKSSDETSDSDEEEINSAETSSHLTMDAQLLNGLQDQIAQLQTQLQQQRLQQQKTTRALEKAPIPDSSATQRPAPFHGYDSEDVIRWLNKIESYLKLRRIDPATPTALAELSLNLAGPAEDFYYSLPEDHKSTFNQLRDALRERFANDNQSWLIWQSVTTRQQGTLEPLDTYLSDLTNKFRRLNITDAEKMRYFVQGLRADVRKTVLLRQPTTFREAEEIARLACSVENTMSSAPVSHMAAQLNQLSQAVNSLATVQNTSNLVPPMKTSEDKKIVSLLEHNNAVLAEVRSKLENSPTSQVPIPTSTIRLNGPQAVAALHDTSNVSSDNTNRARSEIQQLKEMIQNLGREMDARIRGLARRQQPSRPEQPRERTRDGRPVCFTCGRTGHLQSSCPERRSSAPRTQQNQQQRSQGSNYSTNSNYNIPRDNYRNLPQRNRQDQRLAVLDEDFYDDEFVAPVKQNSGVPNEASLERRENTAIPKSVVALSTRKQENEENLHTELTAQNLLLPSNQGVLTPQGSAIAQKHTRRLATREPQVSYIAQDHASNSALVEPMTEQHYLSAPGPSSAQYRSTDDVLYEQSKSAENPSGVADSIPSTKEELPCFTAKSTTNWSEDIEHSLQPQLTQALTDTEVVPLRTQDTPEVDVYSPQPPAASPETDKPNYNATHMYTDEPENSSPIPFSSGQTTIGQSEATAGQGNGNEIRSPTLNTSSSTPLSTLVLKEKVQPVEEISPQKQSDQISEEPYPHVAPVSTPPSTQQASGSESIHTATKPRDLTVTARLNGQDVRLLVDTGAGISVIDEHFLTELYGGILPALRTSSSSQVKTVSGEAVPVLGNMKVTLQIAGGDYSCDFLVVRNLAYEALLGRDFLRANGAVIDLKLGTLQLDDQPKPSRPERECPARVWSTCVIPPSSEAIIPASLDADFTPGVVGLLEGSERLIERYHLQGAAALVTLSADHTVPFRLINPTHQPVTLYKGTTLGTFINTGDDIPVFSLETKPPESNPSPVSEEQVPVDLSNTDLSEPQKTDLQHLLNEYRDIFALSSQDLGRTDLVQHHIDTGTHPPIRQRPYRVPASQKERIEHCIDDMLAQGIICPSTSAWSSPVILVKKARRF